MHTDRPRDAIASLRTEIGAIKSSVERAYRRGTFLDERRKLMAAWAAYCEGPAAKTGGKVVALRA